MLKSEGNSDSTLLLRPKELWKAFLINIKNRKLKRTDARYRRAQEKSSLPALLSHTLIAVMGVTHCPNWSKVDDRNCGTYSFALDNALAEINIPAVLLGNRVADNLGHSLIESYYNDVLSCVTKCCADTIPQRKCRTFREEHVVPGWNEYVDEKHKLAREAFSNWVLAGKPRQEPEHLWMQQTRSRFKYALRYCQQHELQIGADMLAESLANKDCKGFWDRLKCLSNDKATSHATTVGGCCGENSIVDMWKDHFEGLYNSVDVSDARGKFMSAISNVG